MPITMTLRLDEETKQRLDVLAKATDRSKAYLAMQAIKCYLDSNEWQVRAIQEAIEEADRAGPDAFVDNHRVMDWLESWGTEEEQEPPL